MFLNMFFLQKVFMLLKYIAHTEIHYHTKAYILLRHAMRGCYIEYIMGHPIQAAIKVY